MIRYKNMFSSLTAKGEGAFVPFTVVGYPTIEDSLSIIQAMVDGGADALELGIPFSDPVADGPVIQAAGVKAIENGATPEKCLRVITEIRKHNPNIPIGLLVYGNLLVSKGIERFYLECQKAGVDSVLVADLPVYEAEPFIKAAEQYNICPVFIAPPNSSEENLAKIASFTKGYTYVVARAGVTGADTDIDVADKDIFKKLKKAGAPPSMLGFGISRPEHVRKALVSGADGAISGSAVVAKITACEGDMEKTRKEILCFVSEMKQASCRPGE